MRNTLPAILLTVTSFVVSGCGQPNPSPDTVGKLNGNRRIDSARVTTDEPEKKIRRLLDGGLKNWVITNFGGEGAVESVDGEFTISMGYPMTGITWSGDELPTENYQLSLEARKIEGNDFFCGLTFPVGESHCSLILGGWGGSLVGLSCIDGDDASNNGTKQFHQFETGRWYRIIVYVDTNGIEVKLDDQVIIDQARGEHKFTVRNETLPCRPLGICNFQTSSAIRNLVLETFE